MGFGRPCSLHLAYIHGIILPNHLESFAVLQGLTSEASVTLSPALDIHKQTYHPECGSWEEFVSFFCQRFIEPEAGKTLKNNPSHPLPPFQWIGNQSPWRRQRAEPGGRPSFLGSRFWSPFELVLFPSEAVTECPLQQFFSLAAHQSPHVESCTLDSALLVRTASWTQPLW
ncbi:uncharacterized protein LOC112477154 isoform X2 [Pteropus alecto]|uniref:uncharacterized protein LOC112477154 isoform X2 n=1 Tax=Pteropus alecto TaxID=9402 RepID=UPI000D53A48F|nr:uncharacterized protein LOC112477154 isoform X2 [Pteropus alecto]